MDELDLGDLPVESTLLSDTLLEVTDTLVVLVDAQEKVRYMNPAAKSLTGYTADDFLGSSVFETMIPEGGRAQARRRWDQVWDGASDERHECHWLTKTGEVRHIALASAVVRLEEGAYLLATGTDTTQLRQLEEDVVSVSENERRRIGQELHDGLASELVAATMSLENLRRRVEQDLSDTEDLLERLSNVEETVRQGAQQARSLSHLLAATQIQPENLSSVFAKLVRKQAQVGGTECHLHLPGSGIPSLSSTTVARHLYRIAQEALQNAIKHANPAHVHLDLELDGHTEDGQVTGQALVLRVRDDGSGLPDEIREALGEGATPPHPVRLGGQASDLGIGFHLMQYRSDLIGADLTIESEEGQGTTITCTLPLEQNTP